ncbi:MAG: class I tRNA ligase family protein [Candidatus Woesearchaeota archaeon]
MPDFKAIQDKWQKKWEEDEVFKVKEDKHRKKFYCLEMFPYPSASFLHMGHVRNYSIGDAIARFKRLNGYNVLYPMGYDSFGLPAENAAKKQKIHPREYTENSIKHITRYLKELGLSYDWSRMIATHRPEYYKWNQYFFIKFYEKGLVYRKKAPVNFCPSCNTVLANEEVEKGKCWRCENDVIQKELDQWFFKTTAYTEELLNDIQKLNWSDKIKAIQENWIGKSAGLMVNFKLDDETPFPIFTTRPDTIYGVTFMVIALNHPKLMNIIHEPYKKTVMEFMKEIKDAQDKEDTSFLEKNGVFTGRYVINPLTNEKVPLYAGNFVVADYATGAIMAVPAHDQRDFEFAKKYNIPIKEVIAPNIILSGKNAPKENVEILNRKTVTAIVEHWDENKFLTIKETDNQILVGGGIEKGETPEEAIARELKEETGYINFDIKKRISNNLFAYDHRISKNKNQKTEDVVFYIKLNNDKKISSEADTNKHKIVWINKNDLTNTITFDHHQLMCKLFLNKEEAYTSDGVLVNSDSFNGLSNDEAIDKISEFVEKKGLGKRTINYKLKDWLISRQRYWGTPIPMIHCEKCGIVPIPEKDLPLRLPDDVEFNDKGNPLLTSKTFIDTTCPKCDGKARRETDTMGGFMDSSWYFLRYCSPETEDKPFDKESVHYWMPVNQYIGGIEHAVGHLIYSRFFTKALRDMKMLDIDEPFDSLFNQGIVYKDGHKMSKSFGNIVTQDYIASKYGIDTARLFMLFVASPDKEMEWSDKGVEGTFKFLNKVYKLYTEEYPIINNSKDNYLISKKNILIRDVTNAIREFKLNTAVITLIDFVNYLYDVRENISKEIFSECLREFSIILNPFAPHLSEEIYSLINGQGYSSKASWPEYREELIDDKLHYLEEMLDNTRKDILSVLELAKIENPAEIKLIVSDDWKYSLYKIVKEKSLITRNSSEIIKEIMHTDLKKHGQEIMKLVPKLIDKLPSQILDSETEYEFLKDNINTISKIYKCNVRIEKAASSTEQKSKNASPGKPAIVVN